LTIPGEEGQVFMIDAFGNKGEGVDNAALWKGRYLGGDEKAGRSPSTELG